MKMYILVRKDLTTSQQAVQGGHALAEFLLNYQQNWNNSTLIYLGVKSELQLRKWVYKLNQLNIDLAIWKEPDMSNQITAIATYSKGEVFKNVNCL